MVACREREAVPRADWKVVGRKVISVRLARFALDNIEQSRNMLRLAEEIGSPPGRA